MSGLVNLDSKIQEWAGANASKLGVEHVSNTTRIKVSWKRVKCTQGTTLWTETACTPEKADMEFELNNSMHTNEDNEKQEIQIQKELKPKATVTTRIDSGFLRSEELNLRLSAPDKVKPANDCFSSGVFVPFVETTTEYEEPLLISALVRIPPKESRQVSFKVKENQWSGEFTVAITMKGIVCIQFFNEEKLLGVTEVDICEVLPQFGGQCDDGHQKVQWEIKGIANFKYPTEPCAVCLEPK